MKQAENQQLRLFRSRGLRVILIVFVTVVCLVNYGLLAKHNSQSTPHNIDNDSPVAARKQWRYDFQRKVQKTSSRHHYDMKIVGNLTSERTMNVTNAVGMAIKASKIDPTILPQKEESIHKEPTMTRIEGKKPPPRIQPDIDFAEDPMAVLDYAPSRIPGYINVDGKDTLALFGHVMREFTHRVCARQIAQSTILVVAPEAPRVVKLLETTDETDEGELRRQVHHAVGGCTLIHAHQQGHAYHGLNNATVVDDWWRSFDNNKATKPGWILLGMWDHGWQNDVILKQSLTLLRESTVTYIVLGFGANPQKEIYGREAMEHLIELKYKVQILSASHQAKIQGWGKPNDSKLTGYNSILKPNTDITRHKLDMLFHAIQLLANNTGTPVLGYAFATQGLDLAIPSAVAYEPTIKKTEISYKQCPATMLYVHFPPTLPTDSTSSKGFFRRQKHPKQTHEQPLRVSCQKRSVDWNEEGAEVELWYSGETLEKSEAACIETWCATGKTVACTTRIIPVPINKKKPTSRELEADEGKRPNLLLLMIDPISRARFERSLPKTKTLIEALDFVSFSNYTAVGNNSGPNQAALYSGRPLASRDSIATHSQKNSTNQWLWDTLRDYGYATFKAEDGCVENSNMIQSIKPQVHHGDALMDLICFENGFQRPNCVGGRPAAQHLLEYGTQFIRAYEEKNQSWAAFLHFIDSHEDTQTLEGWLDGPLWNFLMSVYERRDCSLQETFHSIPCTVWDNTMIVLISDHGLHYGSYLLSSRGLAERSQPMLHVRLPQKFSSQSTSLKGNKKLFATPFDVYETMLHALVPEAASKPRETTGSTLLKPFPVGRAACNTTEGIPSFVCELLRANHNIDNKIMPAPPSVMSFYADIPRQNKVVTPLCGAEASNSNIFSKEHPNCFCATNMRSWYECTEHPWSSPSALTQSENFAMVDCDDERSFEVHVHRDPMVLRRLAEAPKPTGEQTSVLWIEVDSVSFNYADRHFRNTRELLQSFRLQEDDRDTSGFSCNQNETLCAVEFNAFSVVGANSIPNQIAAFGGCLSSVDKDACSQLEIDAQNRSICMDSSHPAHMMELVNWHRSTATFCRVDEKKRSPWIFDIAKRAGYATLLGEEFCFDKSIYIPQGNIFPLTNVDILPHEFFCRATERRADTEGFQIVQPMWRYEYSPVEGMPGCIDKKGGYERSRVVLDHIESMWNSYHDTPKFAYLNAIAAHQYDDFDSMANLAETYDLILSSFLRRFFTRPDMANTVVIVRSDHGLQNGPMTVDFSLQVEALRPWTELIVPKTLAGLSLKSLFDNQDRLATSFDLYKTLSNAIAGHDTSLLPTPSTWSFNLWKETIPSARTCFDAHVPNAYCIFESQRLMTSPNLRTCNMAEADQTIACPQYADTFQRNMSAGVLRAIELVKNLNRSPP